MKLHYFAWVRERVGKPQEDVELPASTATSKGSRCRRMVALIHPPVIGGKNAISRAPAIVASA